MSRPRVWSTPAITGRLAAALLTLAAFASPASAGTLSRCSQAIVQGFAPSSPFPMTITSATNVPARSFTPEYCDVKGSVETHNNTANFEAWLPSNWNSKYLQYGCGGFCGAVGLPGLSQSSAVEGLQKGYAIAATDDGHQTTNSFDASWALAPNGADKLIDFAYRAVHAVSVSVKQLVQSYYSAALADSYFNGCSDGGREGLKEAELYPADFNGIIAGDPYLGSQYAVQHLKADFGFLKPPQTAFLPSSAFALIDKAVEANCDETDGVKDGLIQNPLACSFHPESLLCWTHGNTPPNCLTHAQVSALTTYLKAVTDERGDVFIEGQPVSDLGASGVVDLSPQVWFEATPPQNFTGPEPWGSFDASPPGWQFPDATFKFFVYKNANFDTFNYPMTNTGVASDRALVALGASNIINADDPRGIFNYVTRGGTLLMYDGLSDGVLSPYPTMRMFKRVAALAGGFSALGTSARLFEVPGMHHCGGGPGPNTFDPLTALENWVEHGQAPDSMVAEHFADNLPSNGVDRTMPLCPFPTEATYLGGPVDQASSWRCIPNRRLLRVSYDGRLAGVNGKGIGGDRGFRGLEGDRDPK